jgi:hypothetical protein
VFLGHFAVAFAAKRVAPTTSLGVTFAACQWLDLIWPVFLATGLEEVRIQPGDTAFTPLEFLSYPWSHSLLMACVWAAAFALFRRKRKDAVICAAVVVSHWVLDWLTHRPDLPLVPGGARYGLGLWNHTALTVAVELALFASAVAIYAKATKARDKSGKFGLLALVLLLVVIYFGNAFGPPPPSISAIIASCFALWLLPLWAWRIDRRRQPTFR